MPLSLSTILKSTPRRWIRGLSSVRVLSQRTLTFRSMDSISALVKIYKTLDEAGKSPPIRTHKIIVSRKEKNVPFYMNKSIMVFCDCEDFMYRWEFALFSRKATFLIRSDGNPPGETNPMLTPGACRHVAKMLSVLLKNKL